MIQLQTNMDSRTLLEARDVTKTFQSGGREIIAVRNLNFCLKSNEIISLVGPSGCGKTTSLRLAAGLEKPTAGSISAFSFQNKGENTPICSFVFQKPLLFPWRTTVENIMLPVELTGQLNEKSEARCKELISAIGLTGFETVFPSSLSGGMAQRASVARALINTPDILFLDEPFSAVDEITRERLWIDFRRLWRGQNISVFIVTHSIREAVFFADKAFIMTPRPGTICAEVGIDLPSERSVETLYQPKFSENCEKVRDALVKSQHNHETN